jgi:hypothetical protein
MAAVVVNCPPFKGALTACHPAPENHRRHADAGTKTFDGSAAAGGPSLTRKQGITPCLRLATNVHHIPVLALHLEVTGLAAAVVFATH